MELVLRIVFSIALVLAVIALDHNVVTAIFTGFGAGWVVSEIFDVLGGPNA